MNKDLFELLTEQYPDQMEKVYPAVGDAWYPIVDYVAAKISKISKQYNQKIYFTDIKDKFGGIRMYIALESGDYRDEAYHLSEEVIDRVSAYTNYVCGYCGKYMGTPKYTQWGGVSCKPNGRCESKMNLQDPLIIQWTEIVSDKSKEWCQEHGIMVLCQSYVDWAINNSIDDLEVIIKNMDKIHNLYLTFVIEGWGLACKDSGKVKNLLLPILKSKDKVLVEGAIYGLQNLYLDPEVKSELRKLINHSSKPISNLAESIIAKNLEAFR